MGRQHQGILGGTRGPQVVEVVEQFGVGIEVDDHRNIGVGETCEHRGFHRGRQFGHVVVHAHPGEPVGFEVDSIEGHDLEFRIGDHGLPVGVVDEEHVKRFAVTAGGKRRSENPDLGEVVGRCDGAHAGSYRCCDVGVAVHGAMLPFGDFRPLGISEGRHTGGARRGVLVVRWASS